MTVVPYAPDGMGFGATRPQSDNQPCWMIGIKRK